MSDGGKRSIFRDEALRHHREGREHGDVVRVPRGWGRAVVPLALVVAVVAGCFAWFGTVTVYAEGPARVLVGGGRTLVSGTLGGHVASLVRQGQTVWFRAGDGKPEVAARVIAIGSGATQDSVVMVVAQVPPGPGLAANGTMIVAAGRERVLSAVLRRLRGVRSAPRVGSGP